MKDRNTCLMEFTSQVLSNSIENVACLPTEERYVARVEVALQELNERLKEWTDFVGLRNVMMRSKNPTLPYNETHHAHPEGTHPRQRIRLTNTKDGENVVDPQILHTAAPAEGHKTEDSPVAGATSPTSSSDSSMASAESSAAPAYEDEDADGDEDEPMI